MSVILCFVVSGAGYGEIPEVLVNDHMEAWTKREPSLLNYLLLEAKIDYIMRHPDNYEYVWMRYDMDGSLGDFSEIPEGVNTADKIIIVIDDIREDYLPDVLSLAGRSLLEAFEMQLTTICASIKHQFSVEINKDIVGLIRSREDTSLAYFYQGKYHLWKE